MPFDTTDPRPMAGIRVLDLATFIAAPYCATIMAEFGAEVIKVELPKVGDPLRRFGTPTDCGDTLVWLSEARNKKSVTLDLRTPEGVDLLKRLAAESDIVCENFQPGTLEEWGVGWDDLKAVNPRLVMVRVSAYGQFGPYRDRPGFGRIANAFGGISYLAGEPDGVPVTPGSATLADYLSGLYGALGALLALRVAERTGEGQVVDIGLYETIFRILDELAPAYQQGGFVRERMGAGTVNAVPHSHYPTKDGKWVAIACTNDKIFARLAAAMGRDEWAEEEGEFATIAKREAARFRIDALVSGWTATMDRDEVLALCDRNQVPCGPVYAVDEIFDDPQYKARDNIARVDSRVGEIALPNVFPRLVGTPGSIDWTGEPLGAHNDEIYGGLLGVAEDALKALRDKGVI